jgi:cytoskeleton protein RodZ
MSADRPFGDFGSKLRTARERRGISLRQIAGTTKISMAALEALEGNDISRLPGGIFSRAFVRSYASEVGLDPDATIQDFIAQFPQATVAPSHSVPDQVRDIEPFETDRRMSTTFVTALVIGVPLAGVLLYFGTAGRRPSPAAAPAAATMVATAPEPAAAPPSPALLQPESPAPVRPAVDPAPALPRATPAADESFMVGLSVKRPCWVSATVDGHVAIERLLAPGDLRKIEVRRELVLTAGDASAVTLTLNGAEARSLGKTGEVVTARLNLTNFKGYVLSR